MTIEKLFEMIGEAEERYLRDSEKHTVCLPYPQRKKGIRIGRYVLPYSAAILIMVCVCSLTAVATAGILKRQEALREAFGIEDGAVPEYEEFEITSTQQAEVTTGELQNVQVHVISGIRDELEQTWYFTVSPVSREIAERYTWFVEGSTAFPFRSPGNDLKWYSDHADLSGEDAIMRWYIEDAYDEETQSLLLEVQRYLPTDGNAGVYPDMNDPDRVTKPQTLTVYGGIVTVTYDEETDGFLVQDFEERWRTQAVFTPTTTDIAERVAVFGEGLPLINEKTGESGRIIDMSFQAGGLVKIRYTYPEAAETWATAMQPYGTSDNKTLHNQATMRQADWINALESVLIQTSIRYTSGKTYTGFGSTHASIQDGIITGYLRMPTVTDIDLIQAVIIDGQEYPLR